MEEKNVSAKRRAYMGLMKCLMWFSAGLTCLLVLFLISYVLYKGLPNITWELLSTSPSYLADSIGILPDLSYIFRHLSLLFLRTSSCKQAGHP